MSDAPQALTPAELENLVGTEFGISPWIRIDQGMIDRFADLTGDHQFIHVDPARAAESPFGTTIAHGFLTLSLLSQMALSVRPPVKGSRHGLNYGFDKIRFLSPVPVNARVRGRFTLARLVLRPSGDLLSTYASSVEIEGHARPALSAEWLTLSVLS